MKRNTVFHQHSSLDSEALLDFEQTAKVELDQSVLAQIAARWWYRKRPLNCPVCKSTVICRSQRHGLHEKLLKFVHIVPWRCMSCNDRFFARNRKIENLESAVL
jgi:hypothetical protein